MGEASAACRVCSGENGSAIVAQGARYFHCATCGTLQKVLTAEQYRALNPGYDPGLYLMDASGRQLRHQLQIEAKKRVLLRIMAEIGRDPRGLSLLDVGCGMGGYLLAGRDLGLDVLGFEPSDSHSTVARKVLDLPVQPEFFSSEKVGERRFDIIILSHVTEHILEPGPFIADLTSVLKPGGALMLLTPNAASLAARLTGRAWPMLAPVDHVTMLTPESLRYLEPEDCTTRTYTTEYGHEFASTIGSVLKNKLRMRKPQAADQPAATSAKLLVRNDWRSRLVQSALTAASAPFRAYALARGRGACLNAIIVREKRPAAANSG